MCFLTWQPCFEAVLEPQLDSGAPYVTILWDDVDTHAQEVLLHFLGLYRRPLHMMVVVTTVAEEDGLRTILEEEVCNDKSTSFLRVSIGQVSDKMPPSRLLCNSD